MNLSDVYAKRLAALSEELIMTKVSEIDPKIHNALMQKLERLRSSVQECNILGDSILALSNELERIGSLAQVIQSININDI